jgi:hypothetical protein
VATLQEISEEKHDKQSSWAAVYCCRNGAADSPDSRTFAANQEPPAVKSQMVAVQLILRVTCQQLRRDLCRRRRQFTRILSASRKPTTPQSQQLAEQQKSVGHVVFIATDRPE